MSTIVQKATDYILEFIREHHRPPPKDVEELDMYNDRWIDAFRTALHDFPIVTSNELMQAINYCNEHSEYHDFNQDFTTVEGIASLFLSTVLVELKLLSK